MNIRSSFVKLLFRITAKGKTESHLVGFRNTKIILCFMKLFLCFFLNISLFFENKTPFRIRERRLQNCVYRLSHIYNSNLDSSILHRTMCVNASTLVFKGFGIV